jgi:hypothetical protein
MLTAQFDRIEHARGYGPPPLIEQHRTIQTQGLTTAEKLLAVRKAPLAVTDPDAAAKFFKKQAEHPKTPDNKWKAKLLREQRAKNAAEAQP